MCSEIFVNHNIYFPYILVRVRKRRPNRRNSVMVIQQQGETLKAKPLPQPITQFPTGAPASRSTLLVITSCSTENTCPVTSTDTSECKRVDTHRRTLLMHFWCSFKIGTWAEVFFCLSCVLVSKMVRRWCIYLCCLLMSSATGSKTLW